MNNERRGLLKLTGVIIAVASMTSIFTAPALSQSKTMLNQQWDKTFMKSDKVEYKKVTFKNRYGIALVGDLYQPKNIRGPLAAIVLSGPFGAVKSNPLDYMLKH